jgi:hypothetical protein
MDEIKKELNSMVLYVIALKARKRRKKVVFYAFNEKQQQFT